MKINNAMIESIEKARILQVEADNYHQSFLQNKQKAQTIHKDLVQINERIIALKLELAEKREKERISRENEMRRKLKAEVLKKLEAGKRLTFEEFKLISEDAD